jgi:cytochrome c oxidase subunit 4
MSEQSHVVPVRVYVTIFFSLMILTGLTIVASFYNFGEWNTIIAVTIAIVKATLVVLYFMHLRYSDNVVRLSVVAGVFWLALLLSLTLSDYFSRPWLQIYR